MQKWVARLVRRRGAVALVLTLAGGCSEPETTEPGDTEGAATSTAGDGDGDGGDGGDDSVDADAASGDDGSVNEDGTGAPLPEFACQDRSECVLHSDCCSCVALHADQDAPACSDTSCERGTCEVWGIERYICSHTCLIELVECDGSMVTCADPPPDCEAGMVPSIDERCWSNHCVPEDLCRPS